MDVKELVRVHRMGSVEVRALRGLSLRVDEGELVSVMDPSGSGKTTLLNIAGGLKLLPQVTNPFANQPTP